MYRHFHLKEINQVKHKSCKAGAGSLFFEAVNVMQCFTELIQTSLIAVEQSVVLDSKIFLKIEFVAYSDEMAKIVKKTEEPSMS